MEINKISTYCDIPNKEEASSFHWMKKKMVLASLKSFVIIRITNKSHVPLESNLDDFLFFEFLYLRRLKLNMYKYGKMWAHISHWSMNTLEKGNKSRALQNLLSRNMLCFPS